jgi:Sensors of blue-light using FAD
MTERETLQALTYVSSARGSMTDAGLQHLLQCARANNRREGVTGVLLYGDGNWMQYIEGQPEALQRVYAIIRADRKHHGLLELFCAPVSARAFSGWTMAYAPTHKAEIVRLSNANWSGDGAAGSRHERTLGLSLLTEFWDMHHRRAS